MKKSIYGLAQAVGSGAQLVVDVVESTRRGPRPSALLQPGGTAIRLGMHDLDSTIPRSISSSAKKSIRGSFAYTDA